MVPLTIVMTTFAPAGPVGEATRLAVQRCMRQWSRRLRYDGELRLHVADDGSQCSDYGVGIKSPPASWWQRGAVSFSRQERVGVGASLNKGFAAASSQSPLALLLFDDWHLLRSFDLTPWANVLLRDETIGAVRVGPPHPVRGSIEMSPFGWVLRPERSGYAFSFRPLLVHSRFFESYGLFSEGTTVEVCEREYNERFCRMPGPEILFALPDVWRWSYEVDGYPRPSLAGLRPGEDGLQSYRCTAGHEFDWTEPIKECRFVVYPRAAEYEDAICGEALIEPQPEEPPKPRRAPANPKPPAKRRGRSVPNRLSEGAKL